MDFDKKWGRIERWLLIVGTTLCIFTLCQDGDPDLVDGMIFWLPYLGENGKEELK